MPPLELFPRGGQLRPPRSPAAPRTHQAGRSQPQVVGATRGPSCRLSSRGDYSSSCCSAPRCPSTPTLAPSTPTVLSHIPSPAGLLPVASGLARREPDSARPKYCLTAHAPPRDRWRFVFKLNLNSHRNYSSQDALRPRGRLSMRGQASVRDMRGWPCRCVRPPGLGCCCGSVWAPC